MLVLRLFEQMGLSTQPPVQLRDRCRHERVTEILGQLDRPGTGQRGNRRSDQPLLAARDLGHCNVERLALGPSEIVAQGRAIGMTHAIMPHFNLTVDTGTTQGWLGTNRPALWLQKS